MSKSDRSDIHSAIVATPQFDVKKDGKPRANINKFPNVIYGLRSCEKQLRLLF